MHISVMYVAQFRYKHCSRESDERWLYIWYLVVMEAGKYIQLFLWNQNQFRVSVLTWNQCFATLNTA